MDQKVYQLLILEDQNLNGAACDVPRRRDILYDKCTSYRFVAADRLWCAVPHMPFQIPELQRERVKTLRPARLARAIYVC